jgi:hypothetical protein
MFWATAALCAGHLPSLPEGKRGGALSRHRLPARGAPLHRQVERILDNRKLAPELARAFERGGISRPAPANDPAPARGNTADTQPPL